MADITSYFVGFDLDGTGTEYVLGVNLRRTGTTGSVELLGSTTSANSIPVVIANDQGAVSVTAAGDVAHDAADSGNPIKVGGTGTAALPTAVGEGDRVQASFDLQGQLRVTNEAGDPLIVDLGADNDVTVTSGTIDVQGTTAADAALTADPVTVGGRASTAVPTAVTADGDVVDAWFNRNGALKVVMVDDAGDSIMDGTNDALNVNIVAGAAGGVTHTDNATYTGGSDDGVPAFALYDTTPPTTTDGAAGIVRMDSVRNMHIAIRDGAANERAANVNASNQLEVSVENAVTVDLGANNDIQGDVAHDAADSGNPVKMGGTGTAALPTAVTEGDRVQASFDLQGQLRVTNESSDPLTVDLGTNNDVTITGSVDTELPTAVAINDDLTAANSPTVGALSMGWDSTNTNWNRVEVDDAGHLQVDVLTGGGADTPTNPVTTTVAIASVTANGGTSNFDSGAADDKKLAWVDIWMSVAYKAEIFEINNGAESTRMGVCGGPAHHYCKYEPTHRDYIQVGNQAGVDGFRVRLTNLDDNNDADGHVVFHYED